MHLYGEGFVVKNLNSKEKSSGAIIFKRVLCLLSLKEKIIFIIFFHFLFLTV